MEPVISGLNVEALEGGAIVAYTLSSAQTRTISAWSDLAVSNLIQWPKDRPYLALHDLSNPGVGLLYLTAVEFNPFNVGVTLSGHRAVRDLLASNAGWPIVLALVVSTSLSGRLTRLRIADIASDSSEITSRAFFKRSAAIEWLMRYVETPEKIATLVTEPHAKGTSELPNRVTPSRQTPVMAIPSTPTAMATPIPVTPTGAADNLTSFEVVSNNSKEAKPAS